MSLTSHEQVELRDIKKSLIYVHNLQIIAAEDKDTDEYINLVELEDCLQLEYASMIYHHFDKLPMRLIDHRRKIDSFDDTQCDEQFRFLKHHLHLLLRLLRFPDVVIFDNRSKMPGEEVFLRGLYELRSGDTQYDCATNLFGREYSAQSRAYTWFIRHIHGNFHDLISNNLDWWFRNGFVEQSRKAIWEKIVHV